MPFVDAVHLSCVTCPSSTRRGESNLRRATYGVRHMRAETKVEKETRREMTLTVSLPFQRSRRSQGFIRSGRYE